MWEKYNPKVKKILILAQEEADRFVHNYIGCEHLLLGLIKDKRNIYLAEYVWRYNNRNLTTEVKILFQTLENAICDYCISKYYEALQKSDYELYLPLHHPKIINLITTIILKACTGDYDIVKIIKSEQSKAEFYKGDNLYEVLELKKEIGENIDSLFQHIKHMANIVDVLKLPAKGKFMFKADQQEFEIIVTQEKEDIMLFEIKRR